LEVLEFFRDLAEFRREPVRGNLGFAQNLQRAFDLPLVEIELLLQKRDGFLFRLGKIV